MSPFSWVGLYRSAGTDGGTRLSSNQSEPVRGGDTQEIRFPGRPQFITDTSPAEASPNVIPVIVEPQDDFSRLVEMGFEESSVRAALLASDGDFTLAMNKLTGAD